MHSTSEYGIAAQWRYKEEGGRGENEADEALTWFRQVLEWQQDTAEPAEFMEFLRMDLFRGEIFVFTPGGDVKPLPTGATPIDTLVIGLSKDHIPNVDIAQSIFGAHL